MKAPIGPHDIQGLEYDWLASDAEDAVGFFSTAGGGYAPEELLRDTDAHDHAIEAILGLPASTEADCDFVLPAHLENTWRKIAERGVFAFDADPLGRPYRRVASPRTAVRVHQLPDVAREVARRVRLAHLRFSELGEVPADLLRGR